MTVRARSLRTQPAVGHAAGHRRRDGRGDGGRRAPPARRRSSTRSQRRGEVLARDLAAISQAPLLLYNFTALEQNVARLAAEDDVPYAIVLDADGRVAAHSERPERVGLVLPGALDRRAAEATEPARPGGDRPRRARAFYDFAVPVVVGHQKWGTARIGVSKLRMERADPPDALGAGRPHRRRRCCWAGWRPRWWPGGSRGPVQQLAAGAAAVSRGELDLRIEPATDDEIGGLAIAFNHMTAQLRQQRGALEDANARAAASPRGAGRPQELHRQHPGLADQRHRHRRPRRARGHAQSRRRADDRLLRRRGHGPLLHRASSPHTPELGEILMETIASRAAYRQRGRHACGAATAGRCRSRSARRRSRAARARTSA